MAKNERELLREWASVVSEADPIKGRVEPTLDRSDDIYGVGGKGSPLQIDIGLGGASKGGTSKPRIKPLPGETPRDAIRRAQQDTKPADKPAARAPEVPATAAKDPDAINFKKDAYNAAKGIVGDIYQGGKNIAGSRPVKTVGALGAAGVAANLGLNALTRPGETVADMVQRRAKEIGAGAMGAATSFVQGAGEKLRKDEREAGVEPPPSSNREFNQAFDDLSKPDGRLGPIDTGRKGLDETRVFTQHPVTGQIVQLNVNNISPVINQAFYESYECGAGESAQWQCRVWSSTPVSKLLKDRS